MIVFRILLLLWWLVVVEIEIDFGFGFDFELNFDIDYESFFFSFWNNLNFIVKYLIWLNFLLFEYKVNNLVIIRIKWGIFFLFIVIFNIKLYYYLISYYIYVHGLY